MFKIIRSAIADRRGSFATMFALSILGLVLIAGVAVDLSRMQSTKVKAQDQLDSALLAAARSMNDTVSTLMTEESRLILAQQAAEEHLTIFEAQTGHKLVLSSLVTSDGELIASASTKSTPYFANLLGVKAMNVGVVAETGLASRQAKDVDVVLIADATGSMQTTLNAIQDNMKKFTGDLSNELSTAGIKLGRVRVQFVFFRDYMIDNHKDWTNPRMNLIPGMEGKGPMYVSPFFEVPGEKTKMDRYVDFFVADGGGSFRESGLEAVWEALNTDWRDGEKTVRAIVLWTDAITRPLGDTEEASLTPYPGTGYWSDTYWSEAMGNWFSAFTKEQREAYMYAQYYPKDMASSLSVMQSKFTQFHKINANGKPGVKTMAINIVSNCFAANPCTDWPTLAAWDGVDLSIDPVGVPSNETYQRIVTQVAATVVSQVTAKDIAITH